MAKLSIGIAIAVAAALVSFGVIARAARPPLESPHLVSMAESAQVMQRDSALMQAHGQSMMDDGRRTGDQELIVAGEHWRLDGQLLAQRAQWLTMHPLAPGSLVVSPSELSAQTAWGDLPSTAEMMLHDPSKARELDLEALRWNGLAMRAEGQSMSEHGRVMTEEGAAMAGRHTVSAQTTADLRQAAQTMRDVGGHLEGNGQAMIDYGERLRQSMGYR